MHYYSFLYSLNSHLKCCIYYINSHYLAKIVLFCMGKGLAWVRVSLNTICWKYSSQRLGGQMILENVAYYIEISEALRSSVRRIRVYHFLALHCLNLFDQGSLFASNTSFPLEWPLENSCVDSWQEMIITSMVGCKVGYRERATISELSTRR